MIFGGMQRSSTIDFPGALACVLFTRGCDLDCFYCHNRELIAGDGDQLAEAAVFSFLEKRRGLLDGVVVSGGEPTLQPDLEEFLRRVRPLGYRVKLDTNGRRPRSSNVSGGRVCSITSQSTSRRSRRTAPPSAARTAFPTCALRSIPSVLSARRSRRAPPSTPAWTPGRSGNCSPPSRPCPAGGSTTSTCPAPSGPRTKRASGFPRSPRSRSERRCRSCSPRSPTCFTAPEPKTAAAPEPDGSGAAFSRGRQRPQTLCGLRMFSGSKARLTPRMSSSTCGSSDSRR